MDNTFTCLYCGKQKPPLESSLEHAIPQFMGGEYAPKIFLLTNVCQGCNNKLGLWVDASYARSWFITNYMAEAARLLCTQPDDPGLPLRCMGVTQIAGLKVPDLHVAEHWIGPYGETIIWLRPHDERMNAYTGGNPIDTRKKTSVAYYFPVEQSADKMRMGLKSFLRALKKRKARKILCAGIIGENGERVVSGVWGFDEPTPEDILNQKAIREAIREGEIAGQLVLDTKFDKRFICKLALGIGYSLFGEAFARQQVAAEARKGVWPLADGSPPLIRGVSTLQAADVSFAKIASYPGAVAIIVMRIGPSWVLGASIDQQLPFVIELGPASMSSEYINAEEGYGLLLFPYRQHCIELTVAGLIAHNLGSMKHPALEEIDALREAAARFEAR